MSVRRMGVREVKYFSLFATQNLEWSDLKKFRCSDIVVRFTNYNYSQFGVSIFLLTSLFSFVIRKFSSLISLLR